MTLRWDCGAGGIPFEAVNIWRTPTPRPARAAAQGNETVPTIVIGEHSLVNPTAAQVESLLRQVTPWPGGHPGQSARPAPVVAAENHFLTRMAASTWSAGMSLAEEPVLALDVVGFALHAVVGDACTTRRAERSPGHPDASPPGGHFEVVGGLQRLTTRSNSSKLRPRLSG